MNISLGGGNSNVVGGVDGILHFDARGLLLFCGADGCAGILVAGGGGEQAACSLHYTVWDLCRGV